MTTSLRPLIRSPTRRAYPRLKLHEGVELKTINSPAGLNSREYAEVYRNSMTEFARVVSLSYQAVIGDVRDANFSSMRHAVLQDQATYRRIQRTVVEPGMYGILELWQEAMSVMEPGS